MESPAFIFDLDGTLVDTAPDLHSATNAVLVSEGRRTIDLTAVRHMVGMGARVLIQRAMAATGEPVSNDRLEALLQIFIAHYGENIAAHSRPYPRVVETLAALKARGIRMAVLTNKPHALTKLLLPRVNLDSYFDAVIGAGLRPYIKPDPRMFHDALAALGARRGIMIGDSIADVTTAKGAGAPVILVSYGYAPEPVASLGADAVADDFAEIPSLAAKLSD